MTIETERLIIRPPQPDDFRYCWQMNNDPVAKKYTGGVTRMSCDEALSRHLKNCEDFDETNKLRCIFSVIEKSSGRYIGYCGFQHCEILNGIEILYGYCRDWWNKGYGYEAAQAVLQYGFNVLHLPQIVAAVNPQNIASEKILNKIGMQQDGQVDWRDQGMVNRYIIKAAGL